MNFILKMLIAKYGPVVAKRLFDEYKKNKAVRQDRRNRDSVYPQWEDDVF